MMAMPRRKSQADPAFVDDIFVEEGDDDGAAAEEDSAGEIKVGEEGEAARRVGQGAA